MNDEISFFPLIEQDNSKGTFPKNSHYVCELAVKVKCAEDYFLHSLYKYTKWKLDFQ